MKGWPTRPLREIAKLYQPKTITSADILSNGPYRVFGANGVIGFFTEYNHEESEVAVTCRGATCGTVNFTEPKSWITGNAMVVTPKDKSLDKRYLFYALNACDMSKVISGSAQPQITRKSFEPMEIPVPPLPEQERIVKLLDEADALRKLRAQADRRAVALIPALFHEMFGDVEVNTKNWPTMSIGEVCALVRGSSPRPKSDPRYYGGPIPRLMIEDITRDGWLVTPRVDSLTELGATMSRPVKAGTIVMAVSGNIGLCAQLAVDACVHDGFVAFKELRTDLFESVYFAMAVGQMRRTHQRNQAGAIFQNITTADVKAMKIPVAPLALQRTFIHALTQARELEASQFTVSVSLTRVVLLAGGG